MEHLLFVASVVLSAVVVACVAAEFLFLPLRRAQAAVVWKKTEGLVNELGERPPNVLPTWKVCVRYFEKKYVFSVLHCRYDLLKEGHYAVFYHRRGRLSGRVFPVAIDWC